MTGTEIAKKLMLNILYDNGMVNRLEPEYIDPIWLEWLTPLAEKFFTANPHIEPTDEVLDDIAAGDADETELRFSHLEGFNELNEALNDYFDSDGRVEKDICTTCEFIFLNIMSQHCYDCCMAGIMGKESKWKPREKWIPRSKTHTVDRSYRVYEE